MQQASLFARFRWFWWSMWASYGSTQTAASCQWHRLHSANGNTGSPESVLDQGKCSHMPLPSLWPPISDLWVPCLAFAPAVPSPWNALSPPPVSLSGLPHPVPTPTMASDAPPKPLNFLPLCQPGWVGASEPWGPPVTTRSRCPGLHPLHPHIDTPGCERLPQLQQCVSSQGELLAAPPAGGILGARPG